MNFTQKEPPIVFKNEDLQALEFYSELIDSKICILRLKSLQKIESLLIVGCGDSKITHCYYWSNQEFVELKPLNLEQNTEIALCFDSQITTNAIKIIFDNPIASDCNFMLFKRKIKGLIVATRHDLFGGRFNAMLNAMYLAQKSGLKFGFVWEERIPNPNDKNCSFVEKEEKFFTQEFLKKYSYTQTLQVAYEANNLTFASISELIKGENMQKRWGYRCTANFILNERNVSDLDYEDYREQLPKLFHSIGFLSNYKRVFANARSKASEIGNFIAIHLRGGDAIYTNTYRKLIFMGGIMARIFPVELALDLINNFMNFSNIVIFSEDFQCAQDIKRSLQNSKNAYKIYINEDLIDNHYTKHEKDFFDFYLMSFAEEIFVPNYSTFSLLSAMIGKKDVKTLNQIFSLETQYQVIVDNFGKIDVHPWQKAASLAYLYDVCVKLSKDLNIKIDILQKALYYDEDNSAYRMKILEELLSAQQIQEVENVLKKYILSGEQEFFETLFRKYPGDKESPYVILYPLLQKSASAKYAYISYVATRIALFQKSLGLALKCIKYAFLAEPTNTIFQRQLLEISLLIETQIKELHIKNNQRFKLLGASSRVKSHLAYKLGSAMILNSKSLWGYIRMPYVLSYIKESHKKEIADYEARVAKNPKLKLPKLESYADYKEALREKECLTYKLGEALIKANSVRGGGKYLLTLPFSKKCVG